MKTQDWIMVGAAAAALWLLSRSRSSTAHAPTLKEQMQNLPFVPVDERPNVLIKAMTLDQLPAPPPGAWFRSVTAASVHPRSSVLDGRPLKGDDARPAIPAASVLTSRQREGYYL